MWSGFLFSYSTFKGYHVVWGHVVQCREAFIPSCHNKSWETDLPYLETRRFSFNRNSLSSEGIYKCGGNYVFPLDSPRGHPAARGSDMNVQSDYRKYFLIKSGLFWGGYVSPTNDDDDNDVKEWNTPLYCSRAKVRHRLWSGIRSSIISSESASGKMLVQLAANLSLNILSCTPGKDDIWHLFFHGNCHWLEEGMRREPRGGPANDRYHGKWV